MQGFKNLLPRQLLSDESVEPVVKKSEEHRRITQACMQHFLSIYKNIQIFSKCFQLEIFELHRGLTEAQNKMPSYFIELCQLFKNINIEAKIFSQKSNRTYKQLNNVCNTLFLQYSNQVLNFQQQIRNYQATEQIVFEMSKKYSRSFKNMLSYLESYKNSFTDARLIYNTEQKLKRYQLCQSTFKSLQQDLKSIQQKCDRLTEKKISVRESFLSIQQQMNHTIKLIASKSVAQTKNFVKNYSQYQKTIVTFLAQKRFTLEKIQIATFFESLANTNCAEYFSCQVKAENCKTMPAIFVYIEHLKSEYLPFFKTAFVNYTKQACEKVQKRKQVNKQILDFLRLHTHAIEKYQYMSLKQITGNFEKSRKRFSDLFSNRFISFMKSIHSIFDLAIGINQKLLKSFTSKLKTIETCINQENKHMDMFIRELRANLQKTIGKRQSKKSNELSIVRDPNQDSVKNSQFNKNALYMEDSFVFVDNTEYKKQIKQRSAFLIHLIEGFLSKIETNNMLLKSSINSIVHDYSESMNEFYSLCCQYENLYFGEEEFINNFKKYQIDLDKTLEKQTNLMRTDFGFKEFIVQSDDQRKVSFDGEISKVQEFKKLKKPNVAENQLLNKKLSPDLTLSRKQSITFSQTAFESENDCKAPPAQSDQTIFLKNSGNLSNLSNSGTISKELPVNKSQLKTEKYLDFLCKKVTFQESEQYVKSFSCAFYDRIILQGRIFITNFRLCFYSNFNPSNIFFGDTFIEIPKKDITKIEKRSNALVFDNSINITTVNGEMFFTSFFSRDEAYDLINKTLEINLQEQFFQAEEETANQKSEQKILKEIQTLKQQDDLNLDDEQSRNEQVLKLLEIFPYQTILQCQYEIPKINAMKFFRLFDSGQEVHINRRTYKSFLQFVKDSINHKEIQIHHFQPNILEYLNFNNIKCNTPIKIERKLNAMVPISAAGIPFLPKAARSDEVQALYFISKDQYIIQSTIQNSGAPYVDCFNVKIKRTVESTQENKVRLKAEMYVNFTKTTIMKSMIESKAFDETKNFFVKMSEEIKKYFKTLQKVKKQQKIKGQNGEQQQLDNNSESVQKLRLQLQASLEQKEKLEKNIQSLRAQDSRLKQFLFASVILNIFLMLLLLN